VATTRSVGAGQPLGEAQVRDGVALAGAPHFGRQRFQARKRDLTALAPQAQPTLLRAAAGKGELLSRITVSLDADADCTRFASAAAVTRTYDLLAVEPTSERAFASACATLDVDLISLDLCRRLPFKRVALSRVRYALLTHALAGSACRRCAQLLPGECSSSSAMQACCATPAQGASLSPTRLR